MNRAHSASNGLRSAALQGGTCFSALARPGCRAEARRYATLARVAASVLSRLGREGGISSLLLCVVMFAVPASAQKKPPAKPIDLNTASLDQLQQLPGVGPVMAQSILDFRKKSGPFRRPEDLLAIRGISEDRYRAIEPYVIVSPPKPAVPARTAASPPKPAVAASAAPKPATPPEMKRRAGATK